MGCVNGFVIAVPTANKDAYRAHAAKAAELFKDCGAVEIMEAWGTDVPDDKVWMENFAQAMMDMPFDGKRMVFGGFTPIFELGR